MSFKILIVFATQAEADTLIKIEGITPADSGYRIGKTYINILITGIGSVATAWSMKEWLSKNERPDIIINAGIAGSFKNDIRIGEVVMPVTDCFADAGIEDGEQFLTLFEAGLDRYDNFPFTSGILHGDQKLINRLKDILRPVDAITVNTASGSEATINKLLKKFNPDIETMEGATFFYLCTREKIPFLALRAISNRMETRNRKNWNIGLALENLSERLKEVIIRLE